MPFYDEQKVMRKCMEAQTKQKYFSVPEINNVFFANSAYSLFTYLVMFPDKVASTLFVVGPAIQNARMPLKLQFDTPTQAWSQSDIDKEKSIVLNTLCQRVSGKNVKCYANLTTPYAEALLSGFEVHALSDGLSDYDRFPAYYKNDKIVECFSTADVIGALQNPKLKMMNIQALWQNLSEEHEDKIADIFQVSTDTLNKAATKQVMLITQPLSEDGVMSEQDKVNLYRNIVSEYGVENVVIKPHPREKTNWATVFPNAPIIPRQVPVELLAKLADVKKVSTFFSTAAFGSVGDENIDFYAADFSDLRAFHPNQTRQENGVEYKSVAVSDIEQTYRDSKGCNWKRIPDPQGHFYHADLEIDEAGIPTHISTRNRAANIHTKVTEHIRS